MNMTTLQALKATMDKIIKCRVKTIPELINTIIPEI